MFQKVTTTFIIVLLVLWNIKDGLELNRLSKQNESGLGFLESQHSDKILVAIFAPIKELINSDYFHHSRFRKFLDLDPANYNIAQSEADFSSIVEDNDNSRSMDYLEELKTKLGKPDGKITGEIRDKILYKQLLHFVRALIGGPPRYSSIDSYQLAQHSGLLYLMSGEGCRNKSLINGVPTKEFYYKIPYNDTLVMNSLILSLASGREDGKVLDSLMRVDTFLVRDYLE